MGIDINTRLWTANPCVHNATFKPRGIMVHSTAAPGAMAAGWYDRWNNNNREVGVHAFVDDTSIWQYLPWDTVAWHSAGKANWSHIAFEMCEDKGWTAGYFAKVYANAVALCVYLCQKYGLTEKDVLCHSEGYKKGIANNHADVMHWFPKFGVTMDDFRADVHAGLQEKEDENMTGEEIYKKMAEYCRGRELPDWAKEELQEAVDMGITDGKSPMELIPRYQAAIMAKRAAKK